jgi:hypothetical protein
LSEEEGKVAGDVVVRSLEDEGVFALIVTHVGVCFLLLEGVAEVEEGPVSLVLTIVERLLDSHICLVVIKHAVVVGREDVRFLVYMNGKCTITSNLVILLDFWGVDGESIEQDGLRLPVASVELCPARDGVFLDEELVIDDLVDLFLVMDDSQLLLPNLEVDPWCGIGRGKWVLS